MRRPAKTKAQKQHDKQQRALLRLRKVAVRWSVKGNTIGDLGSLLQADLDSACDAYTNTLSPREQRKLLK